MWSVGTRGPYDVYLGTRAVAVCRGPEVLQAQATTGLQEGLELLKGWLTGHDAARRLKVWLSGGLCRPWLLPVVDGVEQEAEWLRIAAASAVDGTGLTEIGPVWVERRPAGQSRLAVALQRGIREAIDEALAGADGRRRIVGLAPWWRDALRAGLRRHRDLSALAVLDDDSVTLLAGSGASIDLATALAPIYDEETARAATRRAVFAGGLPDDVVTVRLVPAERTQSSVSMALSGIAHWSS